MSCSNCQSNIKNVELSNRILCENQHILCELCAVTALSECPLCGRSIYKMIPISESNISPNIDPSSSSNEKLWSNHNFLTNSTEIDEESPESEVTLKYLLEQYRLNKDKIQALTNVCEEKNVAEYSDAELFEHSPMFMDKSDSLCNLRISIDEMNSSKDTITSLSEAGANEENPEHENIFVARSKEKFGIDSKNGQTSEEENCIIIGNCFIKISVRNGKLVKSCDENINQQIMSKSHRSNCHISIDGSEGAHIKIDIGEITSTATMSNKMDEVEKSDNQLALKNGSNNRFHTAHCPLVQNTFENSKPSPKFAQLEFYPMKNDSHKLKNQTVEIKSAYELIRDRSPFFCPLTSCNYQPILVSDFAYHLHVGHQKLPFLTIMPGMYRNLYLEPKINKIGVNTCSVVLLLQNKIRDLGCRVYKDVLPILIMSTKVNLHGLIGQKDATSHKQNDELLLIWLTGICPMEDIMEIYCTLTAWSNKGKVPLAHIVHSTKLYSVRMKQDAKSVYDSGSAIILTAEHCRKLTNNGVDMIQLQVMIN